PEDRHSRRLTDAENPDNPLMLDNARVFRRGLERLVAALQRAHVRVFILDDAPQSVVDVPYALASLQGLHLDRDYRISYGYYDVQQHSATQIFARLQQHFDIRILRPQA